MIEISFSASNVTKGDCNMEVLFRSRCCVGCNNEVDTDTPPHPLHKRGQQGGGRPFRKRLILIYCIFIASHVLSHGPSNRP